MSPTDPNNPPGAGGPAGPGGPGGPKGSPGGQNSPELATLATTARHAPPDIGGVKKFTLINATQEAEDSMDLIAMRKATLEHPTGTLATTLHLIKAALGSGIMSGHVAYKNTGYLVALITNVILGLFMLINIRSLITNTHVLCRRSGRCSLSYPDVAECALSITKHKKLRKYAKLWRYLVDGAIALELFGACATYQLVIAKTIKQLVEDQQRPTIAAAIPGYPSLRIYVLAIIIPCVLISLLRYLKFLAPFSFVANGFVGFCIIMTVYYSMKQNPGFENLVPAKNVGGFFSFIGMIVFSMSCACQIMTIENNMSNPFKLNLALSISMIFIVAAVVTASFFGYNAYLEDSQAPITVNFPMEVFPKILKVCVAIMVWVTHALNFFVPFSCVWVYIKRRLGPRPNIVMWEYFFRALIVIIIGLLATAFPSINLLMGFFGCFCLSNVAFIWPQCIEMLVCSERAGFGPYKWRLWKCIIFSLVGFIILVAGTVVHAADLPQLFK